MSINITDLLELNGGCMCNNVEAQYLIRSRSAGAKERERDNGRGQVNDTTLIHDLASSKSLIGAHECLSLLMLFDRLVVRK
jgi:hypothetical protein